MSEAPGLSLLDAAALIGGHVWTERRLFEVLGSAATPVASSAVTVPPSAATRALLDRHAAHAAWRAGQWWDRLPVLAVVDRDALVLPPTTGIAAAYGALAAAHDEVAVLAGAYRVALPRLAAAYRAHGARTAPAADGAARRTLGHVGADLEADRAEGEPHLQSLLVDEAAVAAAAAVVAAMERLLVAR